MSFILDALKKSESERQRQSGPALLEMRIVRPSRALPAWAVVIGALLIVSVAVLAWLALRPATSRAGGAPQLLAAAATGSVAPVAPAAPVAMAPMAPMAAGSTDTVAETDAADAAPANPADTAPAVTAGADAAPPAGAQGNLQNYAAVSGTVPELRLDLHVYAASPAERYAFINMHRVREGDTTPEGVQVRQITREGVVLEYRGAEFLLGR
jgi:general secretion pathway protein B